MTISDSTKIDKAFKLTLGKAYTTTNKSPDNEDAPGGLIVGSSSVFSQDGAITSVAPGTSTSILTFYGDGNTAPRFKMIYDVSSPLNRAWYASTDGTSLTTMRNTRVGNWIPSTFGNYTIRIFLTTGSSTTNPYLQEIFFSDATSPIFDYKSGILTFESDPLAAYAGVAGGPPTGIQIQGYIYIGNVLSQIFDGNGNFTGGLSDVVGSGSGSSQAKFLTTTKSLTISSPNAVGTSWVTESPPSASTFIWYDSTTLSNGKTLIIGGDNGGGTPHYAYSDGTGYWYTLHFPAGGEHTLNSIWAINDSTIYVSDLAPTTNLFLSTDGGVNWSTLASPSVSTEAHIWGSSTTDVYIVAASGAIKHSTNGTTFSSQVNSDSHDLHGVWGSSSSDIFAVGDAGTIRHSTGSGTWSAQTSGTSNNLRGIFGVSSSSVYAVGDNGTVLHFNGTTWSSQSGLSGTFNATGVWGISSSGQSRFYIAGNDGANGAVYFSNGSGSWTLQQTFSSSVLHNIYGSGLNGVYIAAEGGNIEVLHQNPITTIQGNALVDGYVHALTGMFDDGVLVNGIQIDLSTGASTNQFLRYDGTVFSAQTIDFAAMNATVAGRICMYTTGDNALTIEPFGIIINGTLYATPTSGFSLTSETTGFTPGTILYLYAYISGTVAIDVSTTIPDPNTGRRTKTGDVSRSYIGSIYIMTGAASGKIKAFRRVDRKTLLMNDVVSFQAGSFNASVLDGSVARQITGITTTYALTMIPPWVTAAELILSLQQSDVTIAHTVDLVGLGQATKHRLHVRTETLGHEFLGFDPIYGGPYPVSLDNSRQFQLITDTAGIYIAYLNSYED